eukprot:m.87775 g.87775  ORF g.87775 m.87775 type:complete len:84 (+) comp21421_c0_seq3:838-1089(+)
MRPKMRKANRVSNFYDDFPGTTHKLMVSCFLLCVANCYLYNVNVNSHSFLFLFLKLLKIRQPPSLLPQQLPSSSENFLVLASD